MKINRKKQSTYKFSRYNFFFETSKSEELKNYLKYIIILKNNFIYKIGFKKKD